MKLVPPIRVKASPVKASPQKRTPLKPSPGKLLAAFLLLVVAFGCSATAPTAESSESTAWSYTTGYGETITLDAKPEVIVADAYSAAALWEHGIRPQGVFGYGLEEGGSSLALGNADRTTMKVVGTAGDLDIEALAALQPDLVIGFGNSEKNGSAWTWWTDDIASKVSAIAPFAGVRFNERPVVEVIEEYASLARALGADTSSDAATQAKAAFADASATLSATVEKQPDLTTIALNGDAATVYAGTTGLAQIELLADLGVTIVGPDPDEDGGAWATVSWELVPDHAADVVLEYIASEKAFAGAPVYQALPAVKAGQIGIWDDKRPFTYASYAAWLTELEKVYATAKNVTD